MAGGSIPPAANAATSTHATQIPSVVAANPVARTFLLRLYDTARSGLSLSRPWAELADRNQLAKPDSVAEATGRIRKNWAYFRVNYLIILTSVLAISLVTHPGSLIVLSLLLGGWTFLYLFRTEPLTLFGRTFTDREVIAGLVLSTVIVIFLTSVGSLLISALLFGGAIVCLHASVRIPEDLFLDEQEVSSGGLFSFFSSPPNTASVVAVQV